MKVNTTNWGDIDLLQAYWLSVERADPYGDDDPADDEYDEDIDGGECWIEGPPFACDPEGRLKDIAVRFSISTEVTERILAKYVQAFGEAGNIVPVAEACLAELAGAAT